MSESVIVEAMKQIVEDLANWGDDEDVFTVAHHPVDDASLPAVFIQEFAVDDYHPTWGNEIDCSFTIRYALLNRITEEAYERAWRAMDRHVGMPAQIEALANTAGYIEEVTVRSAKTVNILDQEKNTRYLAVDLACDALIRNTNT